MVVQNFLSGFSETYLFYNGQGAEASASHNSQELIALISHLPVSVMFYMGAGFSGLKEQGPGFSGINFTSFLSWSIECLTLTIWLLLLLL